jgi:ribonuclease T1
MSVVSTKRTALVTILLIGLGSLLPSVNCSFIDSLSHAYSKDKGYRIKALQLATISADKLPQEAKATLRLIKRGGPFPFRKDGATFYNREGRLPNRPRNYYREYTVRTPGKRHRGARRIVTGSRGEFYYTNDHYRTFKLIKE